MGSLLGSPEMRRLALASQGWRGLLGVFALALGVALGYGVHGIHAVAVAESEQAARHLAGQADLVAQALAGTVDEALYPLLARRPEVAAASPVVEVEARLPATPPERRDRIKVLGVDVFRAGALQPALVGSGERLDALRPDRVFLNPAAAAWLHLAPGDTLRLQAGIGQVALVVAGSIQVPGPPLAVMDIAGAQAAFGFIGRLTRIDLRLKAGVDRGPAVAALAAGLPAGVRLEAPAARAERDAGFTRAYRVNLDLLAVVALFTGGLLVFSGQALAVLRRRRQLALLRALGLSRRQLLTLLLAEAAGVGLAGGLLGVALGQGLAAAALEFMGPGLGGVYFPGQAPAPPVDLGVAARFVLLGVAAALAGSLLPALEAARAAPARALHAGAEEDAVAGARSPRAGFLLLGVAALALFLPPVAGLPLFAYGAVACLLLGTVALLPWVVGGVFSLLARLPLQGQVPAFLALAQLRGAAGQVALSLAPLVASVAVAAAMAIMVGSFRTSLDAWLERLLPADLYLRAGAAGDSGYLPRDAQVLVAGLPGVARVEFRRSVHLLLAADKPPVTLIARPIDPAAPDESLPLVGPWRPPAGGLPGAWVSEAMVDLYGWHLGQVVDLSLAGGALRLQVLGVWRDYARSAGAIVVDREVYAAASGDHHSSEAALWLAPGASGAAALAGLAAAFPEAAVDTLPAADLKARARQLFERTFAATYGLEVAAVAVGLAGLSASFAALVLARRREFGVLRCLGLSRRQVGALLAWEGGLLAAATLAVGFALAGVLSAILVHVINRQSFHWSMDLLLPWGDLAIFAALVAILASATAVASGRLAMAPGALAAVREDW